MKNTLETARPETKNRLPFIDLLECLAIFFVLTYHGWMHNWDFLMEPTLERYGAYFSRTILSTCVPLFLFVNGYLLFSRPLDLKKHVKKTVRMMLVTMVWMVLLLLVMQPVYGQTLTWEEFWDGFWNLKMGWNNHLWYMGTLVCIYIFFPLLKQAFDTNRKVFYYFTAAAFIMVFGNALINQAITTFNYMVLHKAEAMYNFNFFHMFNPFYRVINYGFVYFCGGGIAFSLQERIEAIPAWKRNTAAAVGIVVSCALLFCLGLGYSWIYHSVWEVVSYGYDTLFTLCNVICLFVLSLSWKKDVWLVRTISCNTLGIYFVHSVFHILFTNALGPVHGLQTPVGTLLYSLALLAVSLLFCLIVKKIPVLKKLI